MTDISLKNIDAQLLNALFCDQWGGLSTFAEKLGVPVPVIQERLQHLEQNGVIKGYMPRLNDDALGFDVTVIFELKVDTNALGEITTRLRDNRRMPTVYRVAGDYDLIVIGKYENITEMNEQVQEFVTNPKIKQANASVVFETINEFQSPEIESVASG
jgi:DNA-binding Lrp family transcriptional regulator